LPFHWLHLLTEPLPAVDSAFDRTRSTAESSIQSEIPNPCSNRVSLCKQRQQTAASAIIITTLLHTAAASHVERPTRRLCICFAARPLWIDTTVESILGLIKPRAELGDCVL
ncbi:hypothetical protein CCMA1212_002312, partial [Trichoderma ghanense]